MTPMDELTRLNRLIRQFQTVSHSTSDPEQRVRVEGEIRDLQSYRERIVAESPKGPSPRRGAAEVERADFPVLSRLEGVHASLSMGTTGGVPAHGCPFQETIQQLSLYTQHFACEYLPLFAARQSALDGRSSRQGEALLLAFHDLDRNVTRFLQDCRRMADDGTGVEAEGETRKNHVALARKIEADAAEFFRSVERFCDSLTGDKSAPGEAIAEMEDFSSEAVAFLDIPETNTQENRRADRY
jgi:hypothetical protein